MIRIITITDSIVANVKRGNILFIPAYMPYNINPIKEIVVHSKDKSFADLVFQVLINCGVKAIAMRNPPR